MTDLLYDNFVQPCPPNTSRWRYDTGRWGASAGEKQEYTNLPANARLDGTGNLELVARREVTPDGNPDPAYQFTSARLCSRQAFPAPFTVQASIQMPKGKGLLPALWTLGENLSAAGWPVCGELDVVEAPTDKTYAVNLHLASVTDPARDVNLGADFALTDSLADGFHTYQADVLPDRVVWSLDGHVRKTITQADATAAGARWPFASTAQFVVLNVAVGNAWTGDPDASTVFPATMRVAWIKVTRP
jgi:beta-glucanase (GH16 family)